MLEWDALLRRLQALTRTQFLPVERFVKGEASSSAGLALAAEAGWEEKSRTGQNKETRIVGGRRSGSRGNAGGGPALLTLYGGQRIAVAPSATAQAATKVFAGAVQLVT